MAKVIIIGGSGFIGTHLNLWFQGTDHIVKSLDIVRPRLIGLLNNYVSADATRLDRRYIEGVDYVIWVGGMTSHSEGQQMPFTYNLHNVEGVICLIDTCLELKNPPKIIYVSTTSLYGPQQGVINSGTKPNPIDVYSATKLAGEHYLNIYHRHKVIEMTILRLPNCYGPYGNKEAKFGVINYWLSLAQEGKPISVYGDGSQRRSFLHVDDAVKAIVSPITTPDKRLWGQTFNVLNTHSYSIGDAAFIIAERFGVKVEYMDWPEGRPEIELGDHLFSGELSVDFHHITGWEAQYDLKKGVLATYESINHRRAGAHRQRAIAST
jgi:UDP-glucose 4-epimerase